MSEDLENDPLFEPVVSKPVLRHLLMECQDIPVLLTVDVENIRGQVQHRLLKSESNEQVHEKGACLQRVDRELEQRLCEEVSETYRGADRLVTLQLLVLNDAEEKLAVEALE